MSQSEDHIRQRMCQVGRLMYDKGFIVASDGNISVRLAQGRILITPSGLHKGLLAPEHILIVDEAGQVVEGAQAEGHSLKPTSELPMHLEAYRQRSDIAAVVHAHPPLSVALSIAGIPMTQWLLPEVIIMVGVVPTTPYSMPASTENADAIRDIIHHHDALILERHGSLTVGQDVMQAFMRLEIVEQNARMIYLVSQLGADNHMPAAEVHKLLGLRQRLGLARPGETELFTSRFDLLPLNTS
jgi:L-fuculose-phosphate aldolase